MEIDRKKIIQNKFFESFTYDEIDEILIMSDLKSVNANETFIDQDDYDQEESSYYFVILEGSVHVIVHNTLINILEKGECFGEVAYLTGGERIAQIKAREDGTELLQISGKTVDEQGTQELKYKLMRRIAMALADRLSRSNEIATLQHGPTEGLEEITAPSKPQTTDPAAAHRQELESTLTREELDGIYKENAAKVKLLEASEFFTEFARDEILEIFSFRNAFIKHPDNNKIVSEGDKDRCFFIIIKGTANVVKDGALLKKLARGDTFGEMSILEGSPRTAHVVSDRDCCTIRVDAIILEKAAPTLQLKFYKKFSRILARRLELASKRS